MNTSLTHIPLPQTQSRMTPRPHQREALAAIHKTSDDRALVVMACGTGKSLVAREAVRERSARSVLVTVPSLALAEQVYRAWAAEFPGNLDALIVCSDAAVGGVGVPVTVDPAQIATFLASSQPGRIRLLISTYHSAERIAEAFALIPTESLDFIALDEVHHTSGPAGKSYSVVLDNDRIPASFRLSLTATTRIHEGADGTTDVISMDNERLYGKRVYELTFGRAIERKLLADYEVAVVLVSDRDVHATLLKQECTIADVESSDYAAVAAQIALSRAMHERDLYSVIAFHSRVARSKRFSATLGAVGAAVGELAITSLHMDATTPSSKRATQLETLARPPHGGRVVLNNVRTLTEGVDVPSVDGICLVDPKSSQTDITQAVGRALRLHPDHDRPALILLPVYVGPGESPQAVLEASDFRHVWRVLAVLRDEDERMEAALTMARRRVSSGPFPDTDEASSVLPEMIKVYGSGLVEADFVAALGVHVLEHTTEDWYHWFGLLEKYVAQHGHAAVPTAAGSLGAWAARQRSLHAEGTLLPKRAELLEAQPGWTWRLSDSKRERGRAELESFIAEKGHARVPRGHVTTTGYRLDHFITNIRNRHRDGLTDAAEAAYFEALPSWAWHVHNAKFQTFLMHLDAFIDEYGHARVPQKYKVQMPDNSVYALGNAVTSKRAAYRKGTLPDGQAETLEERPEWLWDGMDALWEAAFAVLASWADKHGTTKVPFDERIDGIVIYRWVLQQKKLIRDGTQPAERRSRLEGLPGWNTA
ncbi:Helicase associated domain protein [Streptomyces sp. NPDC101455]|uniref:DEAD/DEAH box helicase n=1 Tax=Streptomyces sp. NPDC101455 TaxID=3366142 RepID=UPI00380B2367